MTRRDRAALALAYECLRRQRGRSVYPHEEALITAINALSCADDERLWLLVDERFTASTGHHATRLLRARLALLLRVLLRAADDDVFSIECPACRHRGEHGRMVAWPFHRWKGKTHLLCGCGDDAWIDGLRIRPLWEIAR